MDRMGRLGQAGIGVEGRQGQRVMVELSATPSFCPQPSIRGVNSMFPNTLRLPEPRSPVGEGEGKLQMIFIYIKLQAYQYMPR